MITSIDCVPCLIRQIIEASRFFSEDEAFRMEILRDILKILSEADLSRTPPVIARDLYRRLKMISGMDDPYIKVKEQFNSLALSMAGNLTEKINLSHEPLLAAVKLTIAGNVIDSGAKSGLTENEVIELVGASFEEPVSGDIDHLLDAVSGASNILYIADNAGEIVFDRLLIEKLGPGRVTLAVRGFPVINDATIDDARAAGLDKIVKVIENGSDVPGTVVEECSSAFIKIFNEADLVIAKGQGNYETLCDSEREIFFLLKVKCPIIAVHTGFPVGTHAVIRTLPGSKNEKPSVKKKPVSVPFSFTCRPIGIIHSEHINPSETPVQPVYAKGCKGYLELFPEYLDGVKDLDGFSHIYILFQLHRSGAAKLLVKPFLDDTPRGVFATRAPARPNPIGMSIVELMGIEGTKLYLDGLDILDGTPVIDIKPYAARFDRIDTIKNGWHDSVEEAEAGKRGVRGYKGNS